MNGIPHFEPERTVGAATDKTKRCRPYLQIFKNAKLIYTSTGQSADALKCVRGCSCLNCTSLQLPARRWYSDSDISILFPANVVLDGDILIRVRHMSQDGRRVSMLRFVSAAVRAGWRFCLH
jgi:tensin